MTIPIKNGAARAGIKKRVYPHILRHGYAAHTQEQEMDIRYIREWLGHDGPKTTEMSAHIYDHHLSFRNPIEGIGLDDS